MLQMFRFGHVQGCVWVTKADTTTLMSNAASCMCVVITLTLTLKEKKEVARDVPVRFKEKVMH